MNRNMQRAVIPLFLLVAAQPAGAQQASLEDLQFLGRIAYGATAREVEVLRALGREAYLERELVFRGDDGLPAEARSLIDALPVSRTRTEDLAAQLRAVRQSARGKPESEKREMIKALRKDFTQLDFQAFERRTVRALYSPHQLQEMLVWFWFNHFNVFQNKKQVLFLLPDYEENAIRPHVLGKFRDLLRAVLMHPAMLVYLDNAENAKDAINENYARELMELHTLGVNGGYNQADVQALARILTGAGIDLSSRRNGTDRDFFKQGLFAFTPNRHDSGPKTFLGKNFPGERSFSEIERAIDVLCRHPSTAKFISRKLAVYFLADDPPQELLERMAASFSRSDGDIAATLRALFASREFSDPAYAGKKFKDPVQYVYSSIRLLYPAQVLRNYRPLAGALQQLGEPVYGHQTPDGYGMRERDWASSDQLEKRFELARGFVGARARLFVTKEAIDAGIDPSQLAQVRAAHPIDRAAIEPLIVPLQSQRTRDTLARAANPEEWAALALSAPEFMYR
ncbi:MAG TPA: DUF1800 domain-containing protein [Burkholderiales bacterium]